MRLARRQNDRWLGQAAFTGLMLSIIPLLIVLFSIFGPFRTDSVYLYSGIIHDGDAKIVAGEPSIDPNFGFTAQALGVRAALDVLSGRMPLWNHFEGFGTPLLGEMQSAALFPLTWVQALRQGQTIEQGLLQVIAGVGALLFFNKIGLGRTAALAGGMAFELNGVFSWLRNAIFNPVAFLPWILFSVESLRAAAIAERALSQRLPMIGLGACLGALALYAGFPEEVYLYGLLVAAWALFRMYSLSRRQILIFVTDLLITACLTLAISAPLLAAFAEYLSAAELGGHNAEGFADSFLNASAILQYFLPYIYGPIFASNNATVNNIWASTGGYIGFVPLVYAFAALLSPGQRPIKLFLTAWVVMALGVTHGLPGLYSAFMLLPLAKITACYRYLNISWIFCLLFLSFLFINAIPGMTKAELYHRVRLAIGCSLVGLGLAAAAAWPVLPNVSTPSATNFGFLLFAVSSVAVLIILIAAAAFYSDKIRAAPILSGILILEAMAWFLLPYLSYPRHGQIDLDLIAFLRQNSGYQRVIGTDEAELSPNYGSYFGISLLNYNDLPSPKLTGDYIKAKLDPYANPIVYVLSPFGLSPKQQIERMQTFHARLADYAHAGVKFVLAGPNFNSQAAFDITAEDSQSYPLATGQGLEVSAQAGQDVWSPVGAITLPVGTSGGSASGILKLTLCHGADCAEGVVDLRSAEDHQPLPIGLDHPISLPPGSAYKMTISKSSGDGDVDILLYRLGAHWPAPHVVGTAHEIRPGLAPNIRLIDDDLKLVYLGQSMQVYQLPPGRDYFSADACTVRPVSRDRIETFCSRPSTLTRLELSMRGWSASVNGTPTPLATTEGVFQSLDLPQGKAWVRFDYAPWGFRASLVIAGMTLLLIFLVFAREAARRIRT